MRKSEKKKENSQRRGKQKENWGAGQDFQWFGPKLGGQELPTPFTKLLGAIGVKWIREKIKEEDQRRSDPNFQPLGATKTQENR